MRKNIEKKQTNAALYTYINVYYIQSLQETYRTFLLFLTFAQRYIIYHISIQSKIYIIEPMTDTNTFNNPVYDNIFSTI